jgi:signal transduction histidine kinase/ligand-binding sensor domain-containing protein
MLAGALGVALSHQVSGADSIPPLAGYTVTSWTDIDGRPFGAVYAMTQDRDGYLWIATNAGLIRFDGAKFSTWDIIGEPSLPASPAASLHAATDGSLWVGFANGAGTYRITGRHATSQDPGGQLRGSVTAIAEDKDHAMWAVADTGLYRLRDSHWQRLTITDSTPGPLRPTDVTRGRDGRLLLTTTVGLFRSDDGAHFDKLAPGWAWTVDEDESGTLWVTDTVTGFRRVDEARQPREGFGRNGYRLAHDRLGNLWLASIGEGLLRIHANPLTGTQVIEHVTLHTGVLTDSVQALFEDRDGNLWAGTTVGLHRIARQKLTAMPSVGLVTTAAAADSGDIWVGTNYGLVRFTLMNGAWQPHRLTGPTVYVTVLCRQKNGTLWIGAREGLLRLNGDSFAFVALPPAFGHAIVRSLADDGHGGLWIGDGARLFHWDFRQLDAFTPPSGGTKPIRFASLDHHGSLWMAFQDGSLGLLSQEHAFKDFPRNGFAAGEVTLYSALEDSDGATMWFGSSQGISQLKDGRIVTLSGAGLPSVPAWTLAQDADHSIWADLNWGVIRFTPEAFTAAAVRHEPLTYDFYDATDGLSGAPVTNMQSGSTSDGRLWFARGGALTTVDPTSVDRLQPTPLGPIHIEASANGGQPFDTDAGMRLAARLRRLDLNYGVVALTYLNRVRFRYRLDGFDTAWTDAGTRRAASYTNLPPGKYTFRVDAETNNGTWEAAVPWSFSIAPMAYQTWWFDVTCLLAAATLGWAAWRFRLQFERRRLALVLAERARLSREIHDTLLQGMVGVTLQLEDLSQTADQSPEQLRPRLLSARRQLLHYIRDARRSIKNLRSPILEASDLAEALREVGRRTTADTTMSFTLTTTGHLRRYRTEIENEVLRIAHEAVTNAVRHSHATTVQCELAFNDDGIALRIEDDGHGITEDILHDATSHFGIVGMRERAESLGGVFDIGNLATGGTRVEATIPA